jgi:DNA-binding protein Fis
MQSNKENVQDLVVELSESPNLAFEGLIEKNLEDIATILSASGGRKSKLYTEVMTMVEKGLFKIALRRSNNVKSTAAAFLGINRNTFTDKMVKLGINCEKKK